MFEDRIPSGKSEKLKRILYANRLTYGINYDEYFLYNFADLNDAGKRKYFGWKDLKALYDRLDSFSRPEIFLNKKKAYSLFKKFYGRRIIQITSELLLL